MSWLSMVNTVNLSNSMLLLHLGTLLNMLLPNPTLVNIQAVM